MATTNLNATIPIVGAAGPGWATNLKDFAEKVEAVSETSAMGYGADPTGATDSTAAVQAAIDALPYDEDGVEPQGGVVRFAGHIVCSGSLDISGKSSVTFRGPGSPTGGAAAAAHLTYTGAGARFIDARSTTGFTLDGLYIDYSNASFTGRLIDCDHSGAATDTQCLLVQNCTIAGVVAAGQTAALVSLNRAVNCTFFNTNFLGGGTAVWGKRTTADYANVLRFYSCIFHYQAVVPMTNFHQACAIHACCFEPLVDGKAGAYVDDTAAGITHGAITFDACWFGDDTVVGGAWLKVRGGALLVIGCHFGVKFSIGIYNVGNDNSYAIEDNVFDEGAGGGVGTYGVYFDPGATGNIGRILGNNFAVDTPVGNSPASASGYIGLDDDNFIAFESLQVSGDQPGGGLKFQGLDSLFMAASQPANGSAPDGSWCLTQTGYLYFAAGGAWVQKAP